MHYTRMRIDSGNQEQQVRRNSFMHGFWSGMASIGLFFLPRFEPVHYPHSLDDDLNAIGSDMERAIGKVQIAERE